MAEGAFRPAWGTAMVSPDTIPSNSPSAGSSLGPRVRSGGAATAGNEAGELHSIGSKCHWTEELHKGFLTAIFDYALKNGSAKDVHEAWGSEDGEVSLEQIKNHLDGYKINAESTRKAFQSQVDLSIRTTSTKAKRKIPHLHAYPICGSKDCPLGNETTEAMTKVLKKGSLKRGSRDWSAEDIRLHKHHHLHLALEHQAHHVCDSSTHLPGLVSPMKMSPACIPVPPRASDVAGAHRLPTSSKNVEAPKAPSAPGVPSAPSGSESANVKAEVQQPNESQSKPESSTCQLGEFGHKKLLAAIFDYGLRHVKPREILKLWINPPVDLDNDHIRSHLQQYRKNAKRTREKFQQQLEEAKRAPKRRCCSVVTEEGPICGADDCPLDLFEMDFQEEPLWQTPRENPLVPPPNSLNVPDVYPCPYDAPMYGSSELHQNHHQHQNPYQHQLQYQQQQHLQGVRESSVDFSRMVPPDRRTSSLDLSSQLLFDDNTLCPFDEVAHLLG
mmetsp:Transcript_13234/g.24527  ORF Transcript_13234/g.24527 Transcript_13234/m.24527 type:complete len:499 (+) Transcript_13234:156-1652(+)